MDYKGDRLTHSAQAKQSKTRGRHLLNPAIFKLGRRSSLASRITKGFTWKVDSEAATRSSPCFTFAPSSLFSQVST